MNTFPAEDCENETSPCRNGCQDRSPEQVTLPIVTRGTRIQQRQDTKRMWGFHLKKISIFLPCKYEKPPPRWFKRDASETFRYEGVHHVRWRGNPASATHV